MKLVVLVIFLCFSFSSLCSARRLKHKYNGTIKGSTLEYIFGTEYDDEKIHFPAEIKMMILDGLPLPDLFEFLQMDEYKEYHELAVAAYGEKYKDTSIYIKDFTDDSQDDLSSENMSVMKGDIVIFPNKGIFLTQFKTIDAFLKSFSKHIKTVELSLYYLQQVGNFELILDTIEKYCANTVTKLIYRYFHYTHLEYISKQHFPNVKEVSFYKGTLYNSMNSLNRTFPNVNRVAIRELNFRSEWIGISFPNLTHWQKDLDQMYFEEWQFIRVLRESRNLVALGIVKPSESLLHSINNDFPNITELGIIGFYYRHVNAQSVYMNHIKTFTFEEQLARKEPHFVAFRNLKKLNWISSREPELNFLDFINRHKNQIKELRIENMVISDEHLSLISNINTLKRVSFRFDKNKLPIMTANGLVRFITTSTNLTELRLMDVDTDLRKEIFTSFHSFQLPGHFKLFNQGDVYYTKSIKPVKISKWDDSYKFLIKDCNPDYF